MAQIGRQGAGRGVGASTLPLPRHTTRQVRHATLKSGRSFLPRHLGPRVFTVARTALRLVRLARSRGAARPSAGALCTLAKDGTRSQKTLSKPRMSLGCVRETERVCVSLSVCVRVVRVLILTLTHSLYTHSTHSLTHFHTEVAPFEK